MKTLGLPFGIMLFVHILSLNVFACLCATSEPVCEAFDQARSVATARVMDFKDEVIKRRNGDLVEGQRVRLQLVRSYKGVSSKVFEIWQPKTSCDRYFEGGDKGSTFLFYLSRQWHPKLESIIVCGRTTRLVRASVDVSWLNALPKSRKTTFLAGTINDRTLLADRTTTSPPQRRDDALSKIAVTLKDGAGAIRTLTDSKGMFEFWKVPAGRYQLFAEIPFQFRIQDYWIYGTWPDIPDPDGELWLEIEKSGCSEINIDVADLSHE